MRAVGTIRPPGDKSITHRALILGALARGETAITTALTSLDARSTASALRRLGVTVSPLRGGTVVRVKANGAEHFRAPERPIDCGNSGTAARLLLGVLAGCPMTVELTGDASLRNRPMRRVTEPLGQMGATFVEKNGDGLPLQITGGALRSITYRTPAASAQIKSAILLAGLVGGVPVEVTEPGLSRDHSERMFAALGVPLTVHGGSVNMLPIERIAGFEIRVPADPSSAAFLAGAALLAREGELTIEGVGTNPTRTGFVKVLRRMGASVEVRDRGTELGEPVGDITVRPGRLRGTVVAAEEVPRLIDEVPVLAVLASRAEGETLFRGVSELRVKESDRLTLLVENLRGVGVDAEAGSDTLTVVGTERVPRGAVETHWDHRIAMAFAVLDTLPGADIQLSERDSPLVSYPGFFDDLGRVLRA